MPFLAAPYPKLYISYQCTAWWAESGERRAESGGRRAESGGRRAEGGGRRAESGGRNAEGDEKRARMGLEARTF